MAPARLLERNIRPSRRTREEGEDDDVVEESLGEEDEILDTEIRSEGSQSADGEDEDVDEQMEGQMSNVSFGALQKAQEVLLSKKRKRGQDSTTTADAHEEKLQALRARLRQIKNDKAKTASTEPPPASKRGSSSRPTDLGGDDDDEMVEDLSDSDSAPSEEGASTSRTSKHAPMSQTTRHQVTRKRTVISVPKRIVRDPRFDALSQRHTHPGDTDKAYSFLRDYQESEIKDLASAIRASKSEDEKESLRRTMMSMQNRLRAKDHQKRAQEVLKSHRKEEKEKVLQGKMPFYLKKSELKERTLVEKYKGMKGKEREKAMDKKRKKEGQREKKRMPEARRAL